MTEQKAHDTATDDGMPPPVDNDHVEQGAEKFDTEVHQTAVSPQSVTAVEVAVQHLHERMHALEEAFLGYLSHDQHNHPAVLSWRDKMKTKFEQAKAAIVQELARLGKSNSADGKTGSDSGDTSSTPISPESPTKS